MTDPRPFRLENGKDYWDEAGRLSDAGRRSDYRKGVAPRDYPSCVCCARLIKNPTHFVCVLEGGGSYETAARPVTESANETATYDDTGEEVHFMGYYELGSTCARRLRARGVRTISRKELNR